MEISASIYTRIYTRAYTRVVTVLHILKNVKETGILVNILCVDRSGRKQTFHTFYKMMMMIRPSPAKMTTTSWITGTCGCEDGLSVRSSHDPLCVYFKKYTHRAYMCGTADLH